MNDKRETRKNHSRHTSGAVRRGAMAIFVLTGLTGQTTAADVTEYFQNALFNPSEALLRAEERGRGEGPAEIRSDHRPPILPQVTFLAESGARAGCDYTHVTASAVGS